MVQNEASGEIVGAHAAPGEKKPNVFQRIAIFVRQVISEMRKVVVPTRQELIKYTIVVIVFVIVMMAIVYGLDILFSALTTWVFGSPSS